MAKARRRAVPYSTWQRPDATLAARPPLGAGRLIELEPYRRRLAEMHRDATLNAQWDALLTVVMDAWCWRDPDSLDDLEAQVARLRAGVLADWGQPLRKG